MKDLEKAIFSRHEPEVLAALRASVVGVAGCGGLGSNSALSLARAGVGRLILADFDRVEPSNLNRQQYTVRQIGRGKAEALAENLRAAAPFTRVTVLKIKVKPSNVEKLFGEADLLIEAFDRAEEKGKLINAWLQLHPDRYVVAASGLSGYGANSGLKTRRIGRLYVCGDGVSEPAPGISPMAPRVALVANMQANLAVELLVRLKAGPLKKTR